MVGVRSRSAWHAQRPRLHWVAAIFPFACLAFLLGRWTISSHDIVGTTSQQTASAAPTTLVPSTPAPSAAPIPEIQLLTVATKAAPETDLRVNNLLLACQFYGLSCTVLGREAKWGGWGWMIRDMLLPMLRGYAPDKLVVVADAADVFMQGTAERIYRSYRQVVEERGGGPVVVGLETGCPGTACMPVVEESLTKGITGVPHLVNVNGGFVMGPAQEVIKVWESVGDQNPQVAIGLYARDHPELVSVDINQRVITTVVNTGPPTNFQEWADYYEVFPRNPALERDGYAVDSIVANRKSGVNPCFMHFSGTQEQFRHRPRLRQRFVPFDEASKVLVPRKSAAARSSARLRR